MTEDSLPQPDQVDGAPHPRETRRLIGQDAAERGFLDAFNADRLHHGWLITGPRGLGKATLAWRIARFLLTTPLAAKDDMFGAPPSPQTLDIAADHPVMRRTLALSEPRLFLLRRAWDADKKRLKTQLTVDEVRKLRTFFALSATDGGHRVVIVDAADEMNPNAANALLKLLEEPPARTTLLLISHQPSRLLPTIRSRCRELRLAPLSAPDMAEALAEANADVTPEQTDALAELSAGSVGAAIRLLNLDGLKLYANLLTTLATLPDLDRPRALALAESVSGRGAEARLDLMLTLLDIALARLARTGVTGAAPKAEAAPNEAQTLLRLARDPRAGRDWASLAQTAGDRLRHGRAVNLDPASLIFDTLLHITDTATRLTRA